MLPTWKGKLPFLKEVSSVPLQQAIRHLNEAIGNFFQKRGKYPSFKSKSGHQSATFMRNAFKIADGDLTLAKMPHPLRVVWSRPLLGHPSTVTITKDPAGRWFASLQFECAHKVVPAPSNAAIGVDVGLIDIAVTSCGKRYKAPRYLSQRLHSLKRAQRALARKKNGSRNREKAKQRVARLHSKVADQRRDFTHKLSTNLIRDNQAIYVEDLDVGPLGRTFLARAIYDAGWGMLRRQLKYKASWYGRSLIKVPKHYPSTRKCSNCGIIGQKKPLPVRTWTCHGCGAEHDRDMNAAINILAAGHAVSACGEVLSPVPEMDRQPS